MITDRMRINHADTDAIPDYGSLFLRMFDEMTHVNDYCGSDESDVDKLDLITNAAVGSTCLFISGDIYTATKFLRIITAYFAILYKNFT